MYTLVVCVPSYRRNLQLKGLLGDLLVLTHPAPEQVRVEILVVDNNPDGRAKQVVDTLTKEEQGRFEIGYVHETRPGVAFVRNRALSVAQDRDFVAFIDDDERPDKDWLKALWKRWLDTGADVVFGSVEARYAEGAPNWILRGDFHSKMAPEDVIRNRPGATDNCLIDVRRVRDMQLSFDENLSLIGGEDTLFFDDMLSKGATFADASGAITYETVPEERATLDWLKTRWRRTGYTDAMMISRRRPGGIRRVAAFLDGVARLSVGGSMVAAAYAQSGFRMHERVARRLYTYQRGLGMVAFSLNERVEEYGRGEVDPA